MRCTPPVRPSVCLSVPCPPLIRKRKIKQRSNLEFTHVRSRPNRQSNFEVKKLKIKVTGGEKGTAGYGVGSQHRPENSAAKIRQQILSS